MKASIDRIDSLWESMEPGSSLLAALKGLPPQGQRAINLRFWENYTIEEIAEELCISWDEADLLIEQSIISLREHFSQFLDLSAISEAS